MSSIVKLQQAFLAIILADYLLYEAAQNNKSLHSRHGEAMKRMRIKLMAFAYNCQDHASDFMSISDIINSDGTDWDDHHFDISPNSNNTYTSQPATYFPEYLRIWINDILTYDQTSSNSELVKLFIGKGIQRNIARVIISAERPLCQAKGNHYKIEFSAYEPQDDRRFTAQDVHVFASYIAMQANNVGKRNEVTIDGLYISDYVGRELDKLSGDGTFETWVPIHLWPSNLEKECVNGDQQHTTAPPPEVKLNYAAGDKKSGEKKKNRGVFKLLKAWIRRSE